ncbi:hypothetical protein MAPG_00913 [Magnaporthiopsis poae ATCC 64411]|uniref:Thioesterase domain-containing protein n=1 Tax=Magnaporthiopsis poae (strain ATCC 64411 / 73-15) TaxID=644358 RepID=A0A0C4DMA9_MAGP6|nr:hypothetical protein MAPG_00913 [Magnaporthiopsis poae ATCC 64411]
MAANNKASEGDDDARATVQKALDTYMKIADFAVTFFPYVELISATGPRSGSNKTEDPLVTATFRYTVPKKHCNRMGNLHGGAAATIFDYATTMPLVLVSRPGFWRHMGVSRNLSVTYVRPAPCGTTVLVECQVVAVGARLCALRGVMRREDNGQVISTCEHGKVNTDPPVKAKI